MQCKQAWTRAPTILPLLSSLSSNNTVLLSDAHPDAMPQHTATSSDPVSKFTCLNTIAVLWGPQGAEGRLDKGAREGLWCHQGWACPQSCGRTGWAPARCQHPRQRSWPSRCPTRSRCGLRWGCLRTRSGAPGWEVAAHQHALRAGLARWGQLLWQSVAWVSLAAVQCGAPVRHVHLDRLSEEAATYMTSMASALPRPGDMSGACVCQPHCVDRAALHDQANAIRGWEVPCWASSPSSLERAWAPSPGGPAHRCLCVPHPRGCTPRHSLRRKPGDLMGTPCSASLRQRHGSLCWAEMLEAWWLQALGSRAPLTA